MLPPTTRARTVAAAGVLALAISACATTVVEDDDAGDTTATSDVEITEVDDDVAPGDDEAADPTPRPVPDVLAGIGERMSTLSSLIGADGDEDAELERIEADWASVRDDVEADRPELLVDFQAVVDMARTAVVANRPADADKAYVLVTDLLAAYGDGS